MSVPAPTKTKRLARCCKGRKRNGDQCKRKPRPNSDYCSQHEEKPAGGRPTKFTEGTRENILQAISAGTYLSTAAEYAGISYETLRTWLKRGEDDQRAGRETEYSVFSVAVGLEAARVEVLLLGQLREAMENRPDLILKFLSARYPNRWGRRETQVHEHAGILEVERNLLGGKQPVDIPLDVRLKILELVESVEDKAIDATAEEM